MPAPNGAAVTVVLAGGELSRRAATRARRSTGIDEAEAGGALVFHAGTAHADGRLVTNGGRILNVTGVGPTVADARARAYAGVEKISFAGARYRRDVAGA